MNFKGRVKWFLQGSAHHITMKIGFKYADAFPMYFVVGFPRSGTSWLSEMIADYYNLPRPRHYYLPIAFASIIHTHYKPSKKFKNVYYIYRDGRDSYTSSYFKTLKLIKTDPLYIKAEFYKKLFDGRVDNLSKEEHQKNFYYFLKNEFDNQHIWSKHIESWLDLSLKIDGISILSFEGILKDSANTLHQAIKKMDGKVNEEIIEQVIYTNSWTQQMKRPKEQHRTVLRKGKSNSWEEVFNSESRSLFNKECGKTLIKLGYEANENWLEKAVKVTD